MTHSYRAGEFAKLGGVTVKALRHYDRLGLLRPARSPSGQRRYTVHDLTRLHQITGLRLLEIPLKEIGSLLARSQPSGMTIRARRLVLENKRDRLTRAINAMRQAEQAPDPAGVAIGEAVWLKWEAEKEARDRQSPMPAHRVSEARRRLFRLAERLRTADPHSAEVADLAADQRALLDAETGGDASTLNEMAAAARRRHQWPSGMKRYVASLYETDVETWESVADFLDRLA